MFWSHLCDRNTQNRNCFTSLARASETKESCSRTQKPAKTQNREILRNTFTDRKARTSSKVIASCDSCIRRLTGKQITQESRIGLITFGYVSRAFSKHCAPRPRRVITSFTACFRNKLRATVAAPALVGKNSLCPRGHDRIGVG